MTTSINDVTVHVVPAQEYTSEEEAKKEVCDAFGVSVEKPEEQTRAPTPSAAAAAIVSTFGGTPKPKKDEHK